MATRRILVLPPVYHHEVWRTTWEAVDASALLNGLGVEWRESTFFANPRLRLVDAAPGGDAPYAARLYYSREAVGVARVDAAGAPVEGAQAWFDTSPASAPAAQRALGKRLLWAVAAEHALATDAAVLYVRHDEPVDDDVAERNCFTREVRRRAVGRPPCANEGGVDPALGFVFDSLRWCDYHNKELRRTNTFASTDDCFTRLEDERKRLEMCAATRKRSRLVRESLRLLVLSVVVVRSRALSRVFSGTSATGSRRSPSARRASRRRPRRARR